MHMTPSIRPLLKPIIGISAGVAASSLLFTSTFSTSRPSPSSTTNMSSKTPASYPVKQYTPRPWNYTSSDFTRQDSSADTSFYSAPRFVTHIDDMAIASLREYYATVLPTKGRILDFCTSWVSHYPSAVEEAASKGEVKVTGLGMNKAEMDANDVLNGGRVVRDLNIDADVSRALADGGVVLGEEGFDAATNVVSIDYLVKPVEVLGSLKGLMKKGGTVHLVVSNRCFPTKAVGRWLRVDEEERLEMVGDYLHHAGWSNIEIVTLSNGTVEGGKDTAQQGGMQALMASIMGMGRRDPLWVVRAVKE